LKNQGLVEWRKREREKKSRGEQVRKMPFVKKGLGHLLFLVYCDEIQK